MQHKIIDFMQLFMKYVPLHFDAFCHEGISVAFSPAKKMVSR